MILLQHRTPTPSSTTAPQDPQPGEVARVEDGHTSMIIRGVGMGVSMVRARRSPRGSGGSRVPMLMRRCRSRRSKLLWCTARREGGMKGSEGASAPMDEYELLLLRFALPRGVTGVLATHCIATGKDLDNHKTWSSMLDSRRMTALSCIK
jgi:hypothetical protein